MKTGNIIAILAWRCLISTTLLANGCGCTQAACEDGANISIRGLEIDQLYEVEVETEIDTILCTIDTSGQTLITCDKALFYFSQMDGAYIGLQGTPDRVAITVRQNGDVIAEDEVSPNYDEVAPNGELCGPVCDHAEITFAL